MTPVEPPRRPKPITRGLAEEVARMWHTAACAAGAPMPTWVALEEAARNDLTTIAYKVLDEGAVVGLDHNQCHALVEHLLETGVEITTAEASPIDDAFKPHLRSAFEMLAFTNGRHYGLTNFDMGIEEDE